MKRDAHGIQTRPTRGFLAGVAAVFFGAGGTVAAQDVGTAQAERNQQNRAVDEIIVTARKREEKLQEVPIAISAFTEAAIRDQGAHDVADFLQDAPGVNVVNSGGGTVGISLRGISTDLGGNAVGYYLDEVPFTGVSVPVNPDVRSFDVERVEVLRGPQGTLFGEGSQGGTIRIITNDPNTSEVSARVESFYDVTKGGEPSWGAHVMGNVPIVEDKFAIRGVFIQEDEGGYVDLNDPVSPEEDINDNDITSYRLKARLTPVDNLDIVASYWNYDLESASGSSADENLFVTSENPSTTGYDQYTVRISYDLPNGNLFYSFGDTDFLADSSGFIEGFGDLVSVLDLRVRTHEARYSGEVSKALSFTLGYYHRTAERQDLFQIPAFLYDSTIAAKTTADAVFGEAEYALTDRLRFAAGVRYFSEELTASESGTGFGGVPLTAPPVTETSDAYSPRFILSYDASDNLLLYASAASGFRGAQAQPTSILPLLEELSVPLPAVLGPDKIWTYEIGAKLGTADGRLSLEGAVYYSDWNDRVVRIQVPNTQFNGLISSDGTETTGVELSALAEIVGGLTVQAGFSYIDAENAGDVPGTDIDAGDTVEDVSEVMVNASALYRKPFKRGLDGFGRIGVNYASDRENPAFPSVTGPSGEMWLVDARLGVEAEHWAVYLNAENLTNENAAYGYTINNGLGAFEGPRPRPRTFGVELHVSF